MSDVKIEGLELKPGFKGMAEDTGSDQTMFKGVQWGKVMMWIFLLSDTFVFSCFLIFNSCGKEEIISDKSIGEWEIYSITDASGTTTVWEDIKGQLDGLIPEYSCMEFTATITDKIASTKYVFIDENSRGCLSPSISVFTWSIDPDTGFYKYVQGTNVINYLFSFSNNDNRMTWKDQTSGAVTIWDREVTTTE